MLHLLVPCVERFCHVKTSRVYLIIDRALLHKQLIIALFTFAQSWMTHLPPIVVHCRMIYTYSLQAIFGTAILAIRSSHCIVVD